MLLAHTACTHQIDLFTHQIDSCSTHHRGHHAGALVARPAHAAQMHRCPSPLRISHRRCASPLSSTALLPSAPPRCHPRVFLPSLLHRHRLQPRRPAITAAHHRCASQSPLIRTTSSSELLTRSTNGGAAGAAAAGTRPAGGGGRALRPPEPAPPPDAAAPPPASSGGVLRHSRSENPEPEIHRVGP
jgi:hypothetical protein